MPADRRVVLTRSAEDNARLRERLEGVGAELVDYPCITVERAPVDPEIAGRVRTGSYAGAVFVSRNAVRHFFAQVEGPAPQDVVAIGRGTAEVLAATGWPATAVPSEFNAEAAAAELSALLPHPGRTLHVRGDIGGDVLPRALRAAGRAVDEAVVYRTRECAEAALPDDPRPTLVVFASPSAVRGFRARNPALRPAALAIGPTTARAAQAEDFAVTLAPEASVESLAEAIGRWVVSTPR